MNSRNLKIVFVTIVVVFTITHQFIEWNSIPTQSEVKNLENIIRQASEKPHIDLWSNEELWAWEKLLVVRGQMAQLAYDQKEEQLQKDLQKSSRELFWQEGDMEVGQFTLTDPGQRHPKQAFQRGLVEIDSILTPVFLASNALLKADEKVIVCKRPKVDKYGYVFYYALPITELEKTNLAQR